MWSFIVSLIIPFLIWGPFFPDLIVSLSALVFLVYVIKKKEFYYFYYIFKTVLLIFRRGS